MSRREKTEQMRIIGLTGGIATGKSTVARMLAEKGAHIIDADSLAREVVEPGRPAWREIVSWLGESILLPDGTIDRKKLAALVFKDERMRLKLNSIVHPRVGEHLLALTEKIREDHPAAILVYDVPLLVEAGMCDMVELILLVYAPPEVQVERQLKRDGISVSDAEARLKAQMPMEEKIKHAHITIDNSGTLAETARQVEEAWPRLAGKVSP